MWPKHAPNMLLRPCKRNARTLGIAELATSSRTARKDLPRSIKPQSRDPCGSAPRRFEWERLRRNTRTQSENDDPLGKRKPSTRPTLTNPSRLRATSSPNRAQLAEISCRRIRRRYLCALCNTAGHIPSGGLHRLGGMGTVATLPPLGLTRSTPTRPARNALSADGAAITTRPQSCPCAPVSCTTQHTMCDPRTAIEAAAPRRCLPANLASALGGLRIMRITRSWSQWVIPGKLLRRKCCRS